MNGWTSQIREWLGGGAPRSAAATSHTGTVAGPAASGWTPGRIAVAERVWGEGFLDPLAGDDLHGLIRPLGLGPAHSVLDLGAGLGGAARLIVRTTGAWVTGLEPDPLLARLGHERSVRAGLSRRASITACDLERLVLDRRYDAVLARHCLFTVSHKNELIEAVRAALKPRSRFLIIDFVVKHSSSRGPAIDAWRDAEPVTPHPWTVSQMTDRLKSRGFDVRIAEDISDMYGTLVIRAWDRTRSWSREIAGEPELRDQLLAEGALWARRSAAMTAGDLRVFRFDALTPAG